MKKKELIEKNKQLAKELKEKVKQFEELEEKIRWYDGTNKQMQRTIEHKNSMISMYKSNLTVYKKVYKDLIIDKKIILEPKEDERDI